MYVECIPKLFLFALKVLLLGNYEILKFEFFTTSFKKSNPSSNFRKVLKCRKMLKKVFIQFRSDATLTEGIPTIVPGPTSGQLDLNLQQQTRRLTSGGAALRSKLVDGSCQVQSPVVLVDLVVYKSHGNTG